MPAEHASGKKEECDRKKNALGTTSPRYAGFRAASGGAGGAPQRARTDAQSRSAGRAATGLGTTPFQKIGPFRKIGRQRCNAAASSARGSGPGEAAPSSGVWTGWAPPPIDAASTASSNCGGSAGKRAAAARASTAASRGRSVRRASAERSERHRAARSRSSTGSPRALAFRQTETVARRASQYRTATPQFPDEPLNKGLRGVACPPASARLTSPPCDRDRT